MNFRLRAPGMMMAVLVILTLVAEFVSAGTANPDGTASTIIDLGDITFLTLMAVSFAAIAAGVMDKDNSWLIFFGLIAAIVTFVALPAIIDFNTVVITAGINELTGAGTGTIFGIGAMIFTIAVIVGILVMSFNLLTTGPNGNLRVFK